MPQPRPTKESLFWSNFITYGFYNGDLLNGYVAASNQDVALAHIYYDMSWVMWQLRDYLFSLNDSRYTDAATLALTSDTVYLNYLIPANYTAQGYRNFVDGFEQSWLRLGQVNKRDAVILLSQNAAFARDSTLAAETIPWEASREASYALRSILAAERLGDTPRARKDLLITHILGHFDQWFVSQTAAYVKTFMVGLSARALIEVYGLSNSSATLKQQIVDYLTLAADWLWSNMWVASAQSFRYQSVDDQSGTRDPAPDLNQLVTPLYGWLWYVTGQVRHQQRHHEAFDGGVMVTNGGFYESGAYIFNGKQFDQHYWWSIPGLTWATSDPLTQWGGGSGGGSGGSGGGGSGGGGSGGSGGGGTGGSGGSGNIIPALLGEGFPAIIAPIRNESWEQHFQRNSWSNIEDQINAGYTFFLQPTPTAGEFLERIDVGAVIPAGNLISLEFNPVEYVNDVTIVPTIGYSLTDGSYTDTVNATQVIAGSFRYIKIRLQFTAVDDKSFVRIPEIRVKISAKEIRDGGSGSALATDYTTPPDPDDKGTLVLFNKTFIDINQLQVTARYQSGLASGGQAIAYHNFQDVVNPTGFRVFVLNSVTGAAIDGDFDWSAKGI